MTLWCSAHVAPGELPQTMYCPYGELMPNTPKEFMSSILENTLTKTTNICRSCNIWRFEECCAAMSVVFPLMLKWQTKQSFIGRTPHQKELRQATRRSNSTISRIEGLMILSTDNR